MKTPPSKTKQTQAYLLINRSIHLLKTNPNSVRFQLKKSMHHCWGDITFENLGALETIRIGLFYPIIPVLIHECIHHLHPEWNETTVLKWESTVKRYITIPKALKMLRLFLDLLENKS